MAQEDNIILGPRPNEADDDLVVLSPGSEVALLPATNLQDRRLGKVWRTQVTTEDDTYIEVDYTVPRTHGMIAIGPHNMTRGSKYRVRIGDISVADDLVEVPSGVIDQLNMTGDETDVDEDFDTPDGLWVVSNQQWTGCRTKFSFGPASGLASGKPGASYEAEGSQRFRFRLRSHFASDDWPEVHITLMEERSGGWVVINSTETVYVVDDATEKVIDFNWDTNLLESVDNNVGIRISGVPNASGSSPRSNIDIGTVVWYQAVLTGDINYDSGWLDVWPRLAEFGTLQWGVFEWGGYLSRDFSEEMDLWIFHPIRSGVLGRYLRLDFSDEDNADGYLEFGRLLAGPSLQTTRNISYGWSIRFEDNSRVTKSRGGQTWIDEEARYRVLEFTIEHLDKQTVFDQFFNFMDRLGGVSADFVVMVFPGDETQYYNLAMYCRQRDIGAVVNPFFESYSKTFVLEELI